MADTPPPFFPSPRAGRLEMTKAGGETVRAFVPAPLPPHPPIRLDAQLQDVRRNGDWENWLVFYLTGVGEVADQAALTVRRASALFAKHREKIRSLGRAGFTAERVHGLLERRVVATASRAAKELRLSFPAAAKALRNLKTIGVVREITGKAPSKMYVYQPYLDLLTQGTENPF